MIRALFRRAPVRYEHGARVQTICNCKAGFFKKGQRGTVVVDDAQGMYRVSFDNETAFWVDSIEIKRIPLRRVPLFQRLSLSWLRIGWFAVFALACWVVPPRVMQLRSSEGVPTHHSAADRPAAISVYGN